MRLFSAFLILIFAINPLFSQIQFINSEYDFGEILESRANLEHIFIFKNIATNSVEVEEVVSQCDCTSIKWTRGLIHPGDSANIKVVVNVANRPGNFDKTLAVKLINHDTLFQIRIKGKVLPSTLNNVSEYTRKLAGLAFKYQTLNMGVVLLNEITVKSFNFINLNDKEVSITVDSKVKKHFDVSISSKAVLPNEMGSIQIRYHETSFERLGFHKDTIQFMVSKRGENKQKSTPFVLYITSSVIQNFVYDQKQDSTRNPKIFISENIIDLKKVSQDQLYNHEIKVWNKGENPLNILKVESNCRCLSAQPAKNNIYSGDSTSIKLWYDPKGRKGNNTNFLYIFSNDPANSIYTLKLKANIADTDLE